MFRIVGVAMLWALSALAAEAADLEALKAQYYEARPVCRMIEQETTQEQADKACSVMEEIASKMTEAGQCWDNSELVWDKCPLTN